MAAPQAKATKAGTITPRGLVVGVVGPCAAGKSTLVAALKEHGVRARHIAQEHSFVPDMWRRVVAPDVLIYLDVSFPQAVRRRERALTADAYRQQCKRLEHARQHADLLISTDRLTPAQVLARSLSCLQRMAQKWGGRPPQTGERL